MNKAGHSPFGGSSLSNIDPFNSENTSWLSAAILGNTLGPIGTTLAQRFNLKPASIPEILGVAGAFSAGGLAQALGGSLSATTIANILRVEQGSINAVMPSRMAALLRSHADEADPKHHVEVGSRGVTGPWRWLAWILLAAGIVSALFALATCNRREATFVTAQESPVGVETAVTSITIPTGAGVVSENRGEKPVLIVYFDVGRSSVTKDLAAASGNLKAYLTAHPATTLSVSGFNDPTGNAVANAELSKRRAQQVRAALIAAGVSEAAIKLDKPADTNGRAVTNAESRRVEVTVR